MNCYNHSYLSIYLYIYRTIYYLANILLTDYLSIYPLKYLDQVLLIIFSRIASSDVFNRWNSTEAPPPPPPPSRYSNIDKYHVPDHQAPTLNSLQSKSSLGYGKMSDSEYRLAAQHIPCKQKWCYQYKLLIMNITIKLQYTCKTALILF